MNEITSLKQSIEEIKERNKRVELEKAWETSHTRKFSIAILTYFVMIIFMWSLGSDKPYLNAIIPTLGFFLSTLSLPYIKTFWLRSKSKQDK